MQIKNPFKELYTTGHTAVSERLGTKTFAVTAAMAVGTVVLGVLALWGGGLLALGALGSLATATGVGVAFNVLTLAVSAAFLPITAVTMTVGAGGVAALVNAKLGGGDKERPEPTVKAKPAKTPFFQGVSRRLVLSFQRVTNLGKKEKSAAGIKKEPAVRPSSATTS